MALCRTLGLFEQSPDRCARRRWHLVYVIVVLQGLASAVPWNVFVTESEYFGLRVHVPPYSRVLADNFENVNLVISQAA